MKSRLFYNTNCRQVKFEMKWEIKIDVSQFNLIKVRAK